MTPQAHQAATGYRIDLSRSRSNPYDPGSTLHSHLYSQSYSRSPWPDNQFKHAPTRSIHERAAHPPAQYSTCQHGVPWRMLKLHRRHAYKARNLRPAAPRTLSCVRSMTRCAARPTRHAHGRRPTMLGFECQTSSTDTRGHAIDAAGLSPHRVGGDSCILQLSPPPLLVSWKRANAICRVPVHCGTRSCALQRSRSRPYGIGAANSHVLRAIGDLRTPARANRQI